MLTNSKTFLVWAIQAETKIRHWLQQLMLRRAVAQAFQEFLMTHPRWAASLFDEYFLKGSAEPLLARYLESTIPPTPAELAAIWANQLGPMSPSPYSLRYLEVAMAAADFLRYLEKELQNYQVVLPLKLRFS